MARASKNAQTAQAVGATPRGSGSHVCGNACAGGDCRLLADGRAADPVITNLNAVAAGSAGGKR